MSITTNTNVPPHTYRRTADNTPASRLKFGMDNPPTSPKIHELRERYEALHEKKNGSNPTGS
jgi:hypothetical protein